MCLDGKTLKPEEWEFETKYDCDQQTYYQSKTLLPDHTRLSTLWCFIYLDHVYQIWLRNDRQVLGKHNPLCTEFPGFAPVLCLKNKLSKVKNVQICRIGKVIMFEFALIGNFTLSLW